MIKRTFLLAFIAFSLAIGVAQVAVPDKGSEANATAATSDSEPGQPVSRAVPQVTPMGMAELRRDSDTHFRASVTVNGRPVMMLVDSGASLVVLTEADARAVGIYLNPSDYSATAQTANGEVKMAPVIIDRMAINGIERRNVQAAVVQAGLLNQSLLGQSFLGQLTEVSIRDDVMRLR